MLRELEKVNKDFWAYADDIAFGFKSANKFHTKMLIIENWKERNGMKINKGKYELIVINSANGIVTE